MPNKLIKQYDIILLHLSAKMSDFITNGGIFQAFFVFFVEMVKIQASQILHQV